ncbi:hypothetical protein ACIQI8_16160 [Streptomyces sp. NPDC092369]|uniref:hypothetical protein n=1 Tax=Streptomyces sp. NPDC092369 TaxID=3366015 RepID=UPI0037FA40C1
MGSAKVTLGAAAVLVAVLTPTAYAQDGGGGIAIRPASPAPGADVAVRVDGCGQKTATAVSAAFVADAKLTGADGTLVGETRVRSALSAGSYDVQVTCGDTERKGRFTVGGATAEPTAPASPVAPVHAGGGGSAHLAAVDARSAGPGTAQAVTGLVLAGIAVAAVALLGARRSRGTG